MSFFSDFEGRIAALFDTAPQGYVEPFSFKKLAKRAAKEMEAETYEIDGIDTAPALYTILVSSADDALMRPLYASITDELSTFVATQANKKGYTFVGRPLVRFMVDPSLKSGRFAVFAENIDGATLARLRKEEKEFLSSNAGVGGAAAQSGVVAIPAALAPGPKPLDSFADEVDGLDVIDGDPIDELQPLTPLDFAPAPEVPETKRRHAAPAIPEIDPAPAPAPAPAVAECLLIDRQSGRTFKVAAPSGVIGRERGKVDVALTDPNISRRHAELKYDGRYWHIVDLRSTNGTLVNDIDIDEVVLHNGDLITVGLTNLEFREN